MNADRHPTAGAPIFTLPERLDALSADGVYAQVEKRLAAGIRHLTLDAGAMTYLSNKGVRILLKMRKVFQKQGAVLSLANLQAFAQEVLTASGLGADLQILDKESANNTLFGMNPNIDGYRGLVSISGSNPNLTFINNILYGTVEGDRYSLRCLYIADAGTVSRLDNNLYFQKDEGQYIVYTDGAGYHMEERDDHRLTTGWNAHSPSPTNPLFLDPENKDFRLRTGSPAINAGIEVDGRATDYAGNPILATPDIGALESQE